mgnify:CR=1 FL=1
MRRILIAAIAAGALYQAGVASAGCMATVGLAEPPQGIAPGTTWSAEITVLQHGVRPLPNAKTAEPTLTIYLADLAAIPRLKAPAPAPVKYMSTHAVTALLTAPDPGTRIGLRDQFFMILMDDLAARDAESPGRVRE